MKIKTLTYSMKRTTQKFENDTAEVTVEFDTKDKFSEVVNKAKELCLQALSGCDKQKVVSGIAKLLESEDGVKAVSEFVKSQSVGKHKPYHHCGSTFGFDHGGDF
jgi:RNA binding exosome subunit